MSQVSRVGGGGIPANGRSNPGVTVRDFYNGSPGYWFHNDATAEWERRGREIYPIGLIQEAFELRVAFMHLRTIIPLRRDTYRVIRETLTGYISGGLRVDVVAARVAKAADAIYVMTHER